jgi:hypothetical protein
MAASTDASAASIKDGATASTTDAASTSALQFEAHADDPPS